MRLLHEAPLDPRSRFVRMILAEKKLTFDLREERAWERDPEFLTLNPAGETPVLREAGVMAIPGATVIAEYLEETVPEPNLLGSDVTGRVEVRRLLGWFLDKFSREVTEALREEQFLKRVIQSKSPESTILRAAKANLSYHLDYVGWLAEHRKWLGGDTLSLADLAAAAQLSVLDYLGVVDWQNAKEAKEWYAKMKSRPCMQDLLAERIAKLSPPAHYANPDF